MIVDLMWAFYWIDVLSGMHLALVTAALASIVAALINVMTYDLLDRFLFGRMSFAIIFVLCIAANFIPSKQTMYIMLGLKTTDTALQSQMGKKLTVIIEKEIDGWISTKERK
jgi:hypothetical protein